jgi:hypothetical protein
MKYEYGSLSYEKRPLTKHIVIKVIAEDYTAVEQRKEEYINEAELIKNAEYAGQAGACPVAGRDALKKVIDIPRSTIEGFKARESQIGTAAYVKQLEEIKPEDAKFQIASGSIANLSEQYGSEAQEVLLDNGILPLIVSHEVRQGTFVCILNIRETLQKGNTKLDAYVITDKLKPIDIKISEYAIGRLDKVLG